MVSLPFFPVLVHPVIIFRFVILAKDFTNLKIITGFTKNGRNKLPYFGKGGFGIQFFNFFAKGPLAIFKRAILSAYSDDSVLEQWD